MLEPKLPQLPLFPPFGIIHGAGSWMAVNILRKEETYQKRDEHLRGDGEVVESVLVQAGESLGRELHLKARGDNFEKVVDRLAKLIGLKRDEVLAPGKYEKIVAARSLLCFSAVSELGISQTQLAMRFKIPQPAVGMAVSRGEQLAKYNHFSFMEV